MQDKTTISTKAGCFKSIPASDTVISFDWTYKKASDCGWIWADGDITDKLTFKSELRASDNINKVTAQSIVTTISKFPDNLKLQCNFENHVSVKADFTGTASDTTQMAELTQDIDLSGGFSVGMSTDNVGSTDFTIGQAINTKVTLYEFALIGPRTRRFTYFNSNCFTPTHNIT